MSEKLGRLIMFEGPDGAGKTSQIKLARTALEAAGHDIFVSRAHGGTPIGEELREISLGETPRNARADLFVSMAIHSELFPKLQRIRKKGTTVLLDRGTLSMWAYQVYGDGLPREEAAAHIDRDFADFDPDLVICYKAGVQTLRSRMKSLDHFEEKSDGYFGRVIKGYEFAAERYDAVVIDAEASLQDVHDETMRAIDKIL